MFRAISFIIVAMISVPSHQQSPQSPCPSIFKYGTVDAEKGRWDGVLNFNTDVRLNAVFLNIILDNKADLLGNWIGDVTTKDNLDYKISTNKQFGPGTIDPINFFVQYNNLRKVPKIQAIWLNGKEVCNAKDPLPAELIFGTETTRPVPAFLGTPDEKPIRESSTSAKPYSSNPDLALPFTGVRDIDDGLAENVKINHNGCGKIAVQLIPLLFGGSPTREGEWPWQVAIYQAKLFQTIDLQYHCGGTLVSDRHVITAAHCVTVTGTNNVLSNTDLTVFLGRHNLKNSIEGVQVRFVSSITVHPNYNGITLRRDIAIIKFFNPVTFTDRVRPACLWPGEQVDLSNVVGKQGTVVGWGIDKSGMGTEELMQLNGPVVDQETCLRAHTEFYAKYTSNYTFCAGFINQSKSACNGDSGGGMVFSLQGVWHLRGLVSVSLANRNEQRCDPNYYVVFTDVAKFLPWINQNI